MYIIAYTKVSNNIFQSCVAQYELGNHRVTQLLQTVKWIKENTNETSSSFVALENILVSVHLSTGRSCINHNHFHDIHSIVAASHLNLNVKHNVDRINMTNKKHISITMKTYDDALIHQFRRISSGLTESEILIRVYSIFKRKLSIQEYYELLKPLNATHLILYKENCDESKAKSMRAVEKGMETMDTGDDSEFDRTRLKTPDSTFHYLPAADNTFREER